MTDRFRELGRDRAQRHGKAVTPAVHELLTLIDERGYDLTDYREKANAILTNLPARHRAEFDGVVEELPVSEDELAVYLFALSDVTDDLTGGNGGGEGCTNALVDAARSAHGVPLVLKNRDISADGIRPQVILETPPVDGYHGFLTVTTACSAFVYQGVNDAGLVAANTFVDRERDGVDPADTLRNGVLVRRVLEECDTVADARALVEDLPVERSRGLTLSLADEADSALLEIDPRSGTVRALDGDVVPRTNHFPTEDDCDDDSSAYRLARARELVSSFDGRVSVDDLFDVATDHRNGPGPNSICRHAVNEHNDPHALSQSTTVSTSLYRGGTPEVDVVVGNPCESTPHRYRMRTDRE